MKIFLESIDKGVWDVVVNSPYEHVKVVDGKTVKRNFTKWNLDESKRAHYDVKTKNVHFLDTNYG